MADNFQVTQGSGVSIGTTEIGGAHHQKVRPSKVKEYGAMVTIAHSFFTTSYQDLVVGTLTDVIQLNILNDTNGDIAFNFDNGADANFVVLARSSRPMPLEHGATALYGKYLTDPDTGNVYVELIK